MSYITQKASNRPLILGTYNNALTGAYTFPANGDWDYYKNNFEVFPNGNLNAARNWYTTVDDSPLTAPGVEPKKKNDRIMASATAKLKITDYLNAWTFERR